MKYRWLAACFLCLAVITPSAGADDSAPVLVTKDSINPEHTTKTVVYYFYSQPRCRTCRNIETYTETAVHAAYGKEIMGGALQWLPIDTDEPGNEHYLKEYGLFTKAIVVVRFEEGRQVRWKNLDKIWELAGNEQAFMEYIVREVKNVETAQ